MGVYLGDKKIAGETELANQLTKDNFIEEMVDNSVASTEKLWDSDKIASYIGRLHISASGTTIPYRLIAKCTKNSSHKYITFMGGIKYNATIKSDDANSINNAYNPFNFSVNDVGSNTISFQGSLQEISPLWDFIVTTDGTNDYLYFWTNLNESANPNTILLSNTLSSGWIVYRRPEEQETFSEIPSGQTVATSLRTYYRTQSNFSNGKLVSLSDIGGKFKGLYDKNISITYGSGATGKSYVVPLLNITSSKDAQRFVSGTIFLSRSNGAETPTRIELGLSKRYSSSANTLYWIDRFIINDSYFYNQAASGANEYAKLVKFTYNGKTYIGIAFDSRYTLFQYEGVFYDSSLGLGGDQFTKITSYYEDLITNGTITDASDVDVNSLTTPLEFHHDVKIKGKKVIPDDSYSTDEKVIGTWTDGKPLYQKSFFYDSVYTEGWNDMNDISSLNIDSLASLDANAHVTLGGGGWFKAPFIYRDNPALGFDVKLTGPDGTNQKSILQIYKKGTAVDTISVTIKYTKTTD